VVVFERPSAVGRLALVPLLAQRPEQPNKQPNHSYEKHSRHEEPKHSIPRR
jgi:hypothetical protein